MTEDRMKWIKGLFLSLCCLWFLGLRGSAEYCQERQLRTRDIVSQSRITVISNEGWVDSGISVFEDDEIYFQAAGVISLQRGNPIAYCGPNGYDLKTVQQPIRDRNIGALIGKVVKLISIEIDEETKEEIRHEQVEYFYIGSERRVAMPISGRLFLGINENVVGDNSGSFRVTLSFRDIYR